MSGGYVTIPSSDPDTRTNTVAMAVSPDRQQLDIIAISINVIIQNCPAEDRQALAEACGTAAQHI